MKDVPSFVPESARGHEEESFADIDLIITDVDSTLVYPSDPEFFTYFRGALHAAMAEYFGISLERTEEISAYFRREHGGAEVSIFRGITHEHFPDVPVLPPDYEMVYREMSKIDPSGYFQPADEMKEAVARVRQAGIKVAALTDSPDILSRNVLAASGFVPEEDFDAFHAYTRELGPHKKVRADLIFSEIAAEFGAPHHRVLAIGDSLKADIIPARSVHMRTVLISPEPVVGYEGTQRTSAVDVFNAIREKKLEVVQK